MNQAGIYIHVPFCAKKCPYCDFYSVPLRKDAVSAYSAAVLRNLRVLPAGLPSDTVYFGGGTPSLLSGAVLAEMLECIRQRCSLSDSAEITLEANPLTLTPKNLQDWKQAGINRLSLGVQSFSQDVLTLLGRSHTPQQAKDAVLRANAAGFANISIDLMTGTALHTPELLQRELETALSLPVQHISAYILKIEPDTPFGQCPPDLPDDDETAAQYLQMHEFLTQNGFSHYEISNFAKAGFESRHNCKYWRLLPYYGIGPGAHSCHGGRRYAVPRDLQAFSAADTQPETVTEAHAETESEQIMLGLRLREGIDLNLLPDGKALAERAKPLIPAYLRLEHGRLCMTPQGWLVSNAVLVRLCGNLL